MSLYCFSRMFRFRKRKQCINYIASAFKIKSTNLNETVLQFQPLPS